MKKEEQFKIEVKSVDLQVGDTKLKLTVAQAKELRDVLLREFPVEQPLFPYNRPWWGQIGGLPAIGGVEYPKYPAGTILCSVSQDAPEGSEISG